MALPDITLTKGQILITETASASGIQPDDFSLMPGIVVMQYSTAELPISEWPVWFNPSDAQKFSYDSTWYFLLDDSKIKFRESSPL